ncbi:hypothetical protein MMC34_007104 [Xylographa carneopallida]|nr:hypothetical protein [Xylographa carneopallida]
MAHNDNQSMQSSVLSGSPQRSQSSSLGNSARKRAYADTHNANDLEHDNGHVSTKTEAEVEEKERSGKRSRVTDWPLQDTSVVRGKRSKDQKHSRKSQSPQRRRQASRFNWSSRFKEGSMHDRPSNQPPIEYIGQDQFIQEQLMEQYTAERGKTNARTSEELDAEYDAGIRFARPSSMYRFGKALVNAFNPIMAWHGLNGKWKEKLEDETNPEKQLLEERRAKAESVYAELKRAGYPGTQSMSLMDIASTKLAEDRALMSSRDSGIDVDSYRSSMERKRDGLIFDADNTVIAQQSGTGIGDSASYGPNTHTGPKSTLHLREGSITSLKKVKSHFQLSTPKHQSVSPTPIPSVEVDHVQKSAEKRIIREQLSRKDLQKQQRLTKKVSDLETKLEKARRELYQSLDDVPPVPPLPSTGIRRPFVPGALASLPSERLLSGHLIGSTSSLADPATSTMQRVTGSSEADANLTGARRQQIETPTAKRAQKHNRSASRVVSTGKSKSGNLEDVLRHTALKDEKETGGQGETNDAPDNRRGGMSARLNEADLHDSLKLSQGAQDSTMLHEITNNFTANHSSRKEFSTVRRSGFDPAHVDTSKMLAMRSNPDNNVPFGKLSDDIVNLKKEFPDITNDQIIKYFSFAYKGDNQHPIRKSSKHIPVIEGTPLLNTCAVPQERPHTLDHIHAVPPPKTTAWPQRPLSPPPSHDNARNIETGLRNSWGHADSDVVRVSPKKNNNVPPVPKVPKVLEDQKAKVLEEVIEKEEWQWDDDVF